MLSEDKIAEVLGFGEFTTEASKVTMTAIARAIEAAVLEEQAKAVTWKCTSPPCKCDSGNWKQCCYSAPAPEGMVLVPREPTLAMLDCLRADKTPNLELRYRSMIAAAEKDTGR